MTTTSDSPDEAYLRLHRTGPEFDGWLSKSRADGGRGEILCQYLTEVGVGNAEIGLELKVSETRQGHSGCIRRWRRRCCSERPSALLGSGRVRRTSST
jgi:hypothetical protein